MFKNYGKKIFMANAQPSVQKIKDFDEREIHNELDTLRHSCAHILAHAIQRLYPTAKFGIGPTVEDGFYYDLSLDYTLTPEDLPRIEEEMKKIISENQPFSRKELRAAEAISLFEKLNQPFKVEIIKSLGGEIWSTYQEGEFIDLCRGPHVQRTGDIKAFKLLSIAGAYWRGNPENPQLQRIYGTAFFTQKDLDDYLYRLEEAKKRDHRKLGRELDLFSFDPIAPGSPFFHPKGTVLYNRLVQYVRELYQQYDYQEIITPQILNVSLWHKSGHYENYKENMYFTDIEKSEYAVKPMNCPASTFIYSSHKRSYRELPLRFADFGRLHRYEPSGALSGLTRVRTFCQDDAHVFCTLEQVEREMALLIDMILQTYQLFEFTSVQIGLSTRPEKRVGTDALWDQAEQALTQALMNKKQKFHINEGDGAFYGPKIDFIVHDALKRPWQLGTIQLDFNMPERFELEYTAPDNHPHRPVMIHRAVLGSIERFLGVLIEHYAGAFPFWLAPLQCMIVPVNPEHQAYCENIHETLKSHGIRTAIDMRNESLGLKTREAQTQKIPYMLVAGKKEMDQQTIAARKYGEKTTATYTQSELLNLLMSLNKIGSPSRLPIHG